jgi:tRNA-dihydrouridine synthase B
MTLKLGSLELSSPFILAPMESVSDCAYRRVCWDRGASLVWTEMIRARGLARNNKSTLELIDTFDPEVLTGVQLLVANERELSDALEKLESPVPHFRNIRAIDLNFGCPSPEVIRIGAGPALLKRRGKLETIFKVLAG